MHFLFFFFTLSHFPLTLWVPPPSLSLTVPPPSIAFPSLQRLPNLLPKSLLLHHLATRGIINSSSLQTYNRIGYHITWASVYEGDGGDHVDVILSNCLTVDTRYYVELNLKAAQRSVSDMEEEGYAPWRVSTRVRGIKKLRSAFYLIFRPKKSHLEYEHYLGENNESYFRHLEEKRSDNFTLLSQSVFILDGEMIASTIYERDRRLSLGIPGLVPRQPNWISYHNLSFPEFTRKVEEVANQSYSLTSVDEYRSGSDDSRFAVVFVEDVSRTTETRFRWGLNRTEVIELTAQSSDWRPAISLGYRHNGVDSFFLKLTRVIRKKLTF